MCGEPGTLGGGVFTLSLSLHPEAEDLPAKVPGQKAAQEAALLLTALQGDLYTKEQFPKYQVKPPLRKLQQPRGAEVTYCHFPRDHGAGRPLLQ